jgi:lipoyl-dependent peroxiredoxin
LIVFRCYPASIAIEDRADRNRQFSEEEESRRNYPSKKENYGEPNQESSLHSQTHTTGGRDGGASRTSDGWLDVNLSLPGGPGTGTNPEQLLAIGWSACFLSAIKIEAAKMKVRPAELAIDAEVELCTSDEGYSLQARLNVSLPGVDRDVAESLVHAAHQTCPYSKATRGNIRVEINLV